MKTSAARCALALGLVTVACTGKRDGAASADSARAASATTPAVAGTYTLDDFRRLRWISGRWRGFQPDGNKFYEEYRFLNDSTLAQYGFPDSTFAKAADSSRIELRGGTVSDVGDKSRYVATRLDSLGIDFAPAQGATNQFTWAREDSTKWNATLRWTDKDGRAQTVMYALHRFGR